MDGSSAYAQKAKQIMDANSYMTICTYAPEGGPWGAPVFFAFDAKYDNLYFISTIDSRHAENIAADSRVAITIFDSSSPIGVSEGV